MIDVAESSIRIEAARGRPVFLCGKSEYMWVSIRVACAALAKSMWPGSVIEDGFPGEAATSQGGRIRVSNLLEIPMLSDAAQVSIISVILRT